VLNLERIRKNWNERGFSCEVWTDSPGQEWKDYVHDVDELFMLMEGEVELTLAGKSIRLDPEKEVFISAGVVHTVRNIGHTGSRWLYGYKQ